MSKPEGVSHNLIQPLSHFLDGETDPAGEKQISPGHKGGMEHPGLLAPVLQLIPLDGVVFLTPDP